MVTVEQQDGNMDFKPLTTRPPVRTVCPFPSNGLDVYLTRCQCRYSGPAFNCSQLFRDEIGRSAY